MKTKLHRISQINPLLFVQRSWRSSLRTRQRLTLEPSNCLESKEEVESLGGGEKKVKAARQTDEWYGRSKFNFKLFSISGSRDGDLEFLGEVSSGWKWKSFSFWWESFFSFSFFLVFAQTVYFYYRKYNVQYVQYIVHPKEDNFSSWSSCFKIGRRRPRLSGASLPASNFLLLVGSSFADMLDNFVSSLWKYSNTFTWVRLFSEILLC